MIMFIYFFRTIPSMIFEPVGIITLIWAVMAFFFFRKKNKALFWMFAGGVIFMAGWRTLCHQVMLSARYAAFLIYPTLIFCACFSLKSPFFFRWLFKKLKWDFPHRNLLLKLIPVIVLAGLTAGFLCKTFRIDPYSNYRIKAADYYLKHRQGEGRIYIAMFEYKRICWYINRKISEVKVINADDETVPALSYVSKIVKELKNVPGEHYVFFFLNKGDVLPTSDSMKLSPDHGSWQIAARYYTTKHKKREFIVARYKPAAAKK